MGPIPDARSVFRQLRRVQLAKGADGSQNWARSAPSGECPFKAFSSDPRSNGSASINLVHRICVRTRPRIPSSLMRPESLVLACILLVELFARREDLAHMSARPRTERFHGLPQGAAELGQFVIHTLRSGGEDSPRHQAVSEKNKLRWESRAFSTRFAAKAN